MPVIYPFDKTGYDGGMRRVVIFVLVVTALIASSVVHLSKGETLPTPPSILNVIVHPSR
jgi:hypothetical protein